ncbi:hypothetical protein Agub_g28 [Astrephomene gubernaculifera]|uniref:Ion transport domain-containing protein n=1 Tax=Astrephomene gubernaculifera TaxID=47775 RepID=A0AAD3HGW9_9CHLO|nr:hypothetical protein Agub_g28 [Astrephomene gubernaculifera]
MFGPQSNNVRGLSSLEDDDVHRLRPDGCSSTNNGDDDSIGNSSASGEAPRATVNAAAPSLDNGEDYLSGAASAMGAATMSSVLSVNKMKRRVQIQGGDEKDAGNSGPASTPSNPTPQQQQQQQQQQPAGVRLPGQPHSFTSQQAGNNRSQPGHSSGKLPASSQGWFSLGRLNAPLALPPDDLPPLHSAAWFNDLDTLLELLKTSTEPLSNLIWVNRQLYPLPTDPSSATRTPATTNPGCPTCHTLQPSPSAPAASGAATTPSSRPSPHHHHHHPHPHHHLATPPPLPKEASPATAAAALKSLLQRDYLRHACHPLTIAAAHANHRMVDELLKAMAEDGRANAVEYPVTWHAPPEELPPGCPWVTPLAAAALGGSGECVRLLSQAVARRKALVDDRSTYGCFRFRPVVVAQTAEAVQSLFTYGTCHPDTLRYSLCDAARRLAKLDLKAAAKQQQQQQQQAAGPLPTQHHHHHHHSHHHSHSHTHAHQQQQQQQSQTGNKPRSKLAPRLDTDGDDDAHSQDSGPDSPRCTTTTNSVPATLPLTPAPSAAATPPTPSAASAFRLVANALTSSSAAAAAADAARSSAVAGAVIVAATHTLRSGGVATSAVGALQAATSAYRSARVLKAGELMLFRARLFHDSVGRPLAKSLQELQPETLAAVAALSAMVDHGLQPDRFLSHGEHPNLTSTSLLMIVVQNYGTALKAASRAGGGGGGVAGSTSRRSSMGPATSPSAHDPSVLASSMTASSNNWAFPGASDLLSAAHEVLNALVGSLLAKGAVVDDAPRLGCSQVGGYHMAPAHGPEAALHHAFIHGPQELVVRLLQYSSLQPESHEDLVKAAAEAGGATGADAEGSVGGSRDGYASASAAFYSRKSTTDVGKSMRRMSKVPWENGRSSPLLAFGAKMQSALIDGNLPLWLHSGRFSELMEDLIKCTMAADASMVTADVSWLVSEVLERAMAHQFDNLAPLRNARASSSPAGPSVRGVRGGAGAKGQDAPAPNHPPNPTSLPGAVDTALSGSTVIPIAAEATSSPPPPSAGRKSAAGAAAEGVSPFSSTGVTGQGDAWPEQKPQNLQPQQPQQQQQRRPQSLHARSRRSRHRRSSSQDGDSSSSDMSSASYSGEGDNEDGADPEKGTIDEEDDDDKDTLTSSEPSDVEEAQQRFREPRRSGKDGRRRLTRTIIRTPEDNITITIIYSLYRHTADALTALHQDLKDGSLDGPLASMSLGGPNGAAAASTPVVACNAALVDWAALLRLVARIAATTLNPPKSYGAAANQISVFTTAKAVNQLLYARDWALGPRADFDGAGGDGSATASSPAYSSSCVSPSVIDIDLLRAVSRRHPHEAARLLHGMDLLRVELKGYRWDSIPMNLDQDFYAVLTRGEKIRVSSRTPTVAPASVAAAAEEAQRQVLLATRARSKPSTVVPVNDPRFGLPPPLLNENSASETASAGGGGGGAGAGGAGLGEGTDSLTREDILQACIFSNMWTVLTHCLLSSRRLPAYLHSLQVLRLRTYRFAITAQVLQYGSIPVFLCMGLFLATLGLLARGIQLAVRIAGNLVLAAYGRLGESLQPAMNEVGKRLRFRKVQRGLDKMQRGVGKIVRRVDRLAHRATGDRMLTGSTALMTVRIIPHYLSFLGVLLDPDALAEVWLGVTQHYHRRHAHLNGGGGGGAAGDGDGGAAGGGAGGGGLDDDTGPAYLSGRTTRVVCSRVPLSCAAAMPAALLYKLASSPQVNGELFASPLMRAVITWRWRHFTRYFLLLQFLEHLIYMALFMIYAFSLSYSPGLFTTILGTRLTAVVPREDCALPPSGLQRFLLGWLGVMTLTCVVQEFRQILFFKLGWLQQPWNLLDFASTATVATIMCSHFTCNAQAEWLRGLAAIEVALLFIRLLYFAMADDRLGSFFRMVIEVLRDCWLFFVFLGILFTGWGLALSVMQGQHSSIRDTYLQLFTMIFGDFQLSLLQSAEAGSFGLNHLWRIFASVYQILVTIILLNLLIAIINDSYERINDNEACESLRNKLTLIVEAESVLPAGLARRMLESLAATDLYVITAEAATVVPNVDEGDDGGMLGPGGTQRRNLQPPSRWSGRMGETKRFVSAIVDQLTSQQVHFQSRVLATLAGFKNMSHQSAAAEGQAPGVAAMSGGNLREGGSMAPGRGHQRLSAGALGGVGGSGLMAGGGLWGGMSVTAQGPSGGMVGDSEALEEAMDKLLREKLADMQRQQKEAQRKQEEALAAMGRSMNEALEDISERVARAAAHAAAAATQSAVAAAAQSARPNAVATAAASAARVARRAEVITSSPTAAGGLAASTSPSSIGGGAEEGGGAAAATSSSGSRTSNSGGVGSGAGGGGGAGISTSGGGGGGSCGGGEVLLLERGALELVAQRAAEQAAHMAVQRVLQALGHGGGGGGGVGGGSGV